MVQKRRPGARQLVMPGWLALGAAVVINSFSVVLMLRSGAGISAISSVPYAFSLVLPALSLGNWTYLFQGLLIASLMVLRRRFVPAYLFSFVVGFAFSALLDLHEPWVALFPDPLGWRVVYFVVSYLLICVGIALSNRCGLPIIPTDLFPRELAQITGVSYPRIKIGFDAACLLVTAGLTLCCLGRLEGLGVGTVLAALTMGKVIGLIGAWLDRYLRFDGGRFLKRRPAQKGPHTPAGGTDLGLSFSGRRQPAEKPQP